MTADPTTTAQNEIGEIRKMLVKHSRDAFGSKEKIAAQWKQLGYRAAPDLDRAAVEYEYFITTIRELVDGIELIFAPADLETTIDSIYVRDAAVVTDRGVVLARTGKSERRAEPAELERVLRGANREIRGRIEDRGCLEGGDLVWLDEQTIAVGHGYRSNGEGIDQLRNLVGCTVLEVGLPHYRGPTDVFHLMSILSPIDTDLAVTYSPLMPVPFRRLLLDRGIRLVEVPENEFETLGCNVLAVAPRRCLMAAGNPITAARLEAAGAEVHTFLATEICLKGGGGPTCLTRPLLRSRDLNL